LALRYAVTLTFDPVVVHPPSVTFSNSLQNVSSIEQSEAELLTTELFVSRDRLPESSPQRGWTKLAILWYR